MFNRINNFIKDNEFEATIYNNKIHIKNYTRIISLEKNYISLYASNKKLIMKGNNLKLNKILNDEILIQGEITAIEVKNE